MKTDSRYKSHKRSDITKIRLKHKFVEIRVSLNFTKSLKWYIRYSFTLLSISDSWGVARQICWPNMGFGLNILRKPDLETTNNPLFMEV